MKSLFKFCLLSALIVGGKLAKQAAPATMAQAPVVQKAAARALPVGSVVLVHQVLVSEPEKPVEKQPQPQRGGGLLAEMF